MKSIIITGARGLIGSNFAAWLHFHGLDKEYEIVEIDNESGGLRENIKDSFIKSCNYYRYDLATEPGKVEELFNLYKPEYVFHFAAFAAEGASPFLRRKTYENNVVGSATVINCCIKYGVKRLVFTSSMAVYGRGMLPYYETQLPAPIDPYGISKLATELDIQAAHEQHGLEYCILRPHNVYGPGQNIFDSYRNVIGIWMCRALHNLPLQIYGDGKQIRSLTYIGDIVEPIWNAAIREKAANKTIDLGNTPPLPIKCLAGLFQEVLEWDGQKIPEIEYREERYEVKHAYPDGHLSQEILGFEQRFSHYDGIKVMWLWAKNLPDRPTYPINYELEDKIYSYWKN